MKGVLFTILAALVLMALSALLLGIGWLLTGKSRLRKGTCGRPPSKENYEDEKEPCSICGATKICPKKNDPSNNFKK